MRRTLTRDEFFGRDESGRDEFFGSSSETERAHKLLTVLRISQYLIGRNDQILNTFSLTATGTQQTNKNVSIKKKDAGFEGTGLKDAGSDI